MLGAVLDGRATQKYKVRSRTLPNAHRGNILREYKAACVQHGWCSAVLIMIFLCHNVAHYRYVNPTQRILANNLSQKLNTFYL